MLIGEVINLIKMDRFRITFYQVGGDKGGLVNHIFRATKRWSVGQFKVL
ncbi:Uncharacterised protein [Vibrio cholerae]|nr:Uncharacterised protein [Vibrio cholerae]